MQALRIVEAFNPVDHVYARPCSAFVWNLVHALDFECLEETLHCSIVPAVGFPTHRLNHSIVLDQSTIRPAGILTSTIGVHDQSSVYRRFGTSPFLPICSSVHQQITKILMYVKPGQGQGPGEKTGSTRTLTSD